VPSDPDPLDLVECELIAGAVVELAGPGRIAGNLLSLLEGATVVSTEIMKKKARKTDRFYLPFLSCHL
jgi:hypothetical protein